MTVDFSPLERLNSLLRRGPAEAESELASLAERVATEANAFFSARKTPVRVTVRSGIRGAVLTISATRKITRPFSGRSPEEVVREILARHVAAGGEQVAVKVARSLR